MKINHKYNNILSSYSVIEKEEIEKLFKLNEYFILLKNIDIRNGYLLKYNYNITFREKYPQIFAEKHNSKETIVDDSKYLSCNGNKESYVEILIYHFMKEQFFLFWHANYKDDYILINKNDINYIIEILYDIDFKNSQLMDNKPYRYVPLLSIELQKNLDKLNPEPNVIFVGDYAIVSIYRFTKWGGVYNEKYKISRKYPHILERMYQKNVIKVDYNVQY